ncbi:unnamed protein product [Trichobilharzia regenti]|nr:unnamed protein product [Trichobilharzia regenti]
MDKSELHHQIHHFLPQNENLPSHSNLYNISTGEQSGYPISPSPHHHHHHHHQQQQQQHHPPHHPQQMLMTMMMTAATTTFPGINQYYYYSNQSTAGYLEHHGWLNLLDTCGWKKVEVLLFPDLLLIAQKNASGYFNVIKDPIYNTKISYINIPPYASGN